MLKESRALGCTAMVDFLNISFLAHIFSDYFYGINCFACTELKTEGLS